MPLQATHQGGVPLQAMHQETPSPSEPPPELPAPRHQGWSQDGCGETRVGAAVPAPCSPLARARASKCLRGFTMASQGAREGLQGSIASKELYRSQGKGFGDSKRVSSGSLRVEQSEEKVISYSRHHPPVMKTALQRLSCH